MLAVDTMVCHWECTNEQGKTAIMLAVDTMILCRECTNEQGKAAIRLLKECCFKVDVHLMPDLPGSSPELDLKMLGEALYDEDLDADYYKVRACVKYLAALVSKLFSFV